MTSVQRFCPRTLHPQRSVAFHDKATWQIALGAEDSRTALSVIELQQCAASIVAHSSTALKSCQTMYCQTCFAKCRCAEEKLLIELMILLSYLLSCRFQFLKNRLLFKIFEFWKSNKRIVLVFLTRRTHRISLLLILISQTTGLLHYFTWSLPITSSSRSFKTNKPRGFKNYYFPNRCVSRGCTSIGFNPAWFLVRGNV